MQGKEVQHLQEDPVRQFSVFLENKVGKLLETITLLENYNVHVVGITVLDTSDSSIIRLVVDDPDRARLFFEEHTITFCESNLVVVEMKANTELKNILRCLLQAEINIHYTYSFLNLHEGNTGLAISLDDHECAVSVLTQHQFKVLHQKDISR